MATSKPTNKALTRLLDRIAAPIYILSPEFVIVYANQACADWVGVEHTTLVGAKCFFSCQPGGTAIENRIQGLCPPPDAMDVSEQVISKPTRFSVFIVDSENNKTWRQAMVHTFVDSDQNQVGGLVICDHANSMHSPSPDPVACSRAPETLHQALAQIRNVTDRIYGIDRLVGTSPASIRIRRQVKTAIESAADLLIIGPAGSGKEHLARTIHSARNANDRSDMIPFHCSIADQQTIQHNIKDVVASRTQSGFRAEDQQQDWLLLLDVDLLGEAAQNEILGFFQLPNFPLRTIATASSSLIDLATKGKYSAELAYYLSIMMIELVPLAERQIDVPFLAQALLERDNFRRDKQLAGFSKSAMQQLVEFHWPENIDQLNRTIQSAARNAVSPLVTEADFPDEFRQALRALRIGGIRETEIQLDTYLGQIEKKLISRALRQARNNKTKAAKLLGISRPKLLRRLQHFELETLDTETAADSGETDQLDSTAFMELD